MPDLYPPVLTISLDFELHWGRFDKTSIQGNEDYYRTARKAVPEILRLFDAFNIEATWATVGMLFAKDVQEWKRFSPVKKPSYKHPQYSAYHWLKSNPTKGEFVFAPDLVERVFQAQGQELGSHTFSHYYTMAAGQMPYQFREDLQAVQAITKQKFGVVLNSLVFPRNQLNEGYMGICREEGFTTIRSNPLDWYWRDTSHENLIRKIFRTGDTLFALGKKTSYSIHDIEMRAHFPLVLPASRFFRPYKPQRGLLNSWKKQRIFDELTFAAQNREIYHLWWHPHNFGRDMQGCLRELKEILTHFDTLRSEYGMVSLNMKNTSNLILAARENPIPKN